MRIVRLPILLSLAIGAASSTAVASEHDFDFLNGTCVHRNLSSDWANMDEYVLGKPSCTYRAMALRAYDPAKDEWSIWWLDQRFPEGPLDPPVTGRFLDKIGLFCSDYIAPDGRVHRTRFLWSHITPNSAHWEQADSAGGGKTCDSNWTMDFKRREAPPAG